MSFHETVNQIEDLPGVSARLIDAFPGHRLFLLDAEMGCGKTTLIKEICRYLGSKDYISSPTYALVNEYNSAKGVLFHFDLYRLHSTRELEEIGFSDYLQQNAYFFIEWPNLALPLLSGEKAVIVRIQNNNEIRIISADEITIA